MSEVMSKGVSRDYWDTIIRDSGSSHREDMWRAHLKEVYRGLMDRWIDNSRGELTLKTDLFDEAVSIHGLIPLCGEKCERIIGTDVSFEVALVAQESRDIFKDSSEYLNVSKNFQYEI